MKDVGFTPEGNRLVEMTKTEYFILQRLNQAIEGNLDLPGNLPPYEYVFRQGFDFSKTFEVIRAWYTMKFRLNETRVLLDDLQSSMERRGQ